MEPEMLCACGIKERGLVVKPEGKRPFGRHSCRWEDSIDYKA
jgi:hypothetical protein